MKPVGKLIAKNLAKYRRKPQYTTIHHKIREVHKLSLSTYAVIDSIHKLSHNPDYPYCRESKDRLGEFLSLSRRTIFNSIKEAIEKGFIEKNTTGELRTTMKWINTVELYAPPENRR